MKCHQRTNNGDLYCVDWAKHDITIANTFKRATIRVTGSHLYYHLVTKSNAASSYREPLCLTAVAQKLGRTKPTDCYLPTRAKFPKIGNDNEE